VRYIVEVVISLKPVVNDPQGLTVRAGLHQLGFSEVSEVRVGSTSAWRWTATPSRASGKAWRACARTAAQPCHRGLPHRAPAFRRSVAHADQLSRMRFGIAVFPGTWSDGDCARAVEVLGHQSVRLWHRERDLQGSDCVILPGGFAYGDHLRTGAVARFARSWRRCRSSPPRAGLVLGICNGFQILCEAHLLPGALTRNVSLEFRCETTWLRVETVDTPFTRDCERAGCWPSRSATVRAVSSPTRPRWTVWRPSSGSPSATSPATDRRSARPLPTDHARHRRHRERGPQRAGMMPHPERAAEPLLGSEDGMSIFRSVVEAVAERSAFTVAP